MTVQFKVGDLVEVTDYTKIAFGSDLLLQNGNKCKVMGYDEEGWLLLEVKPEATGYIQEPKSLCINPKEMKYIKTVPKFKVGDLVKVKDSMEIVEFKVGDVFEVTGVWETAFGTVRLNFKEDSKGDPNGWVADNFELVEDAPKPETVQKQIKYIKSYDDLKVGEWFVLKGVCHELININHNLVFPLKTGANVYSLAELTRDKAYKIKPPVIEPLEYVELKYPYNVDSRGTLILEVGDVVKFKDGNTHTVLAIDKIETLSRKYKLSIKEWGETYWVRNKHITPENVLEINGIDIHKPIS